jgi:hypothetical protein
MRLGLTPKIRAAPFVVSPVDKVVAICRWRRVNVRSQAAKSMRIAATSAGPLRLSSTTTSFQTALPSS